MTPTKIFLAFCCMASQAVAADDFFGNPTGPTVPSLPGPTTPSSPTVPQPAAPPPVSSAPVANPAPSSPPLTMVQMFGNLRTNLKAWYTFSNREKGGVVWTAEPIDASLSKPVVLRTINGRTVADFSASGAVLKFGKPIPLGDHYTLAAWVAFPIPKGHAGMLFHGAHNALLSVNNEDSFECWVENRTDHVQKFGTAPAPLTGWHHIALTADGKESTAFLDGKPVGSIPLVMKDELSAVGNHPETQHQHWMMTEALDEVFVFNRELSAAELAKLMTIRYGPAAAPLAGVPAVPPQVAATPAPRVAPATPRVAAATPPPAPKATPEPEAPLPPGALSPGEILKTYRKSLVFVSGADGNGSGFVAASGGTNFLFTNAHVAAGIKGAGFKSLEGTVVQVGAASMAVGHDIFRMQLAAATGKPFEIMDGVGEKATIGDDVVVLGNAEGAGVINLIKGKIVGIGPDRVEVDAPFQPGNSGSPIIHLKTGQVIGVATYLTIKKYDATTKEVLKTPVIRRFGFRLDSVKTWQPVVPAAFFAQAAEMQKIETLTADLENFLVDLSIHDGKVTTEAHTNPAIKTRIDQWQGDKRKGMTAKDRAAVNQNFIAFLKVACRSDVTAAQPRMTYDYFQRQLTEEAGIRAEFAEIFDSIIKQIRAEQ